MQVSAGGRFSKSRGIAQNARVSACYAGLGTHMDDVPQQMDAEHPEACQVEDVKRYENSS